jgi:hypothetical protein
MGAAPLKFTKEECAAIEALIPVIQGDRYDEAQMGSTYSNRL